jgi:hypothetical protein
LSQPGAGENATTTVHAFALEPPTVPGNPEPGNANFRMVRMTSGGEIELTNLPVDLNGKLKPLKPGQWIMLAGFRPLTPPNKLDYYHWYRVLSATKPANNAKGYMTQLVTLAGQDWQVNAGNTRVWIFDNIVNVYEKSMPLEIN